MKVIVAGGRRFTDYQLLKSKLDTILSNTEDVTIICGGAKGADLLGMRYALEKPCSIEMFYPDWEKYGKRAGMLRNEEMAKVADACVAFWDGKSRGTANMIELAKQYNLKLRVITYAEPKGVSRLQRERKTYCTCKYAQRRD